MYKYLKENKLSYPERFTAVDRIHLKSRLGVDVDNHYTQKYDIDIMVIGKVYDNIKEEIYSYISKNSKILYIDIRNIKNDHNFMSKYVFPISRNFENIVIPLK